jgi:hypothetical protein
VSSARADTGNAAAGSAAAPAMTERRLRVILRAFIRDGGDFGKQIGDLPLTVEPLAGRAG